MTHGPIEEMYLLADHRDCRETYRQTDYPLMNLYTFWNMKKFLKLRVFLDNIAKIWGMFKFCMIVSYVVCHERASSLYCRGTCLLCEYR